MLNTIDRTFKTIYIIDKDYSDVRCYSCGRLLAKKVIFTQGYLEVKCGHCGEINKIGLQ